LVDDAYVSILHEFGPDHFVIDRAPRDLYALGLTDEPRGGFVLYPSTSPRGGACGMV